jgi:hypothetical protein
LQFLKQPLLFANSKLPEQKILAELERLYVEYFYSFSVLL